MDVEGGRGRSRPRKTRGKAVKEGLRLEWLSRYTAIIQTK